MLAFGAANMQMRDRDLAIYLCARFLSETATLVQSVAIGWRIYEISGSPLSLGFIGLAQFLPRFLLSLPSGELCDRLEPRRILGASLLLEALCSGILFALTFVTHSAVWPFYAVMMLFGAARGVSDPAAQALLPFLTSTERLPKAISWDSTLWQVSVIAGPAVGGLLYALGPAAAYLTCCAAFLAAASGIAMVGGRRTEPSAAATLRVRIERMKDGIRFVRSSPVISGAISLDLIAVLFGGATALLPVYARDILHAGSIGLGLLRSAPAVGACVMAAYQTRRPIGCHIGVKLFAAVAVFGLATIVFGLSSWLPLSLAALLVLGASDIVSVNIRSSLVQLATPDAMRGRVSSVNMLFIGASSELGEFESGLTAALLGTLPAVILGGIGTLLVVPIWMKLFPRLTTLDRLSALHGQESLAVGRLQ
jgi:MFS family permease